MEAASGGAANTDGRAPLWKPSLLYAVLTLLFAYPLSIDPGGRLLSASPDTLLMMWMLIWDTHAVVHQPFSIFEANIYYPQHDTLAYSENLLGSAFFAAPVLWLTGSPVLAINIVSLVSCVLCGAGAFLLARRVGVSRLGATLAGLIFAFSPPRFLRLGQVHLTTIQWIPFGLAYLHAYFDRARKRDLRIAVAFFTLPALTSGHGAVYLPVASAGPVAYRLLAGDAIALLTRLRDFGFTGALLLAPALLIVLPYRRVQVDLGLRRWLVDWPSPFGSLLASPAHLHTLVLTLFPSARINETASAYLFPGYIPLLLAGAAVLLLGRQNGVPSSRAVLWSRAALALELAAVASVAVAIYGTLVGPVRLRLGSTVRLTAREPWRAWLLVAVVATTRVALGRRAPFDLAARGRRARDAFKRLSGRFRQDATIFYLVLALLCVVLSLGTSGGLWALVYWLPGMNFIRIPSRFMCSAPSPWPSSPAPRVRPSHRAAPTQEGARRRSRRRALVAEFAAMPLETIVYPIEIPAIDRWLDCSRSRLRSRKCRWRTGPRRRLRAEADRVMLHSTAHWQKTVHGTAALRPPRTSSSIPSSHSFRDDGSIAALAGLGVRYVVIHRLPRPPTGRGRATPHPLREGGEAGARRGAGAFATNSPGPSPRSASP